LADFGVSRIGRVPTPQHDPRRGVPRTDRLLAEPALAEAAARFGTDAVKRAVHRAQERARSAIISPDQVAADALASLPEGPSSMRPVINATGVVLHTNLGRAALSVAAIEALADAAGYADVEFDLGTGRRARRGRGCLAALADAVPAAEAVWVVNNGAAALLLATTALASGREVVISRGELVEIGDGFRLPDLITSAGARLREVGTTNRTHLRDYEDAIGGDTGCILRVHPSNFRISGFSSATSVQDLAHLGPPVVVDIGSGLLAPEPLLPDEPDADSTLRAGAAVVTASGDKLLGGPQAGLLLGRVDIVDRLRSHPMARALRVDKLTLAALEATLRGPATPTWTALHAAEETLRSRSEAVAGRLVDLGARTTPTEGAVGGGGAPGVALAGWAIALPASYAARLRAGDPAVVGRLERGVCLLDLRCLRPEQDSLLTEAVRAAAGT
jgi:L-seryl-tRNA(Ser) seleniumtransferase